MKWLALIIGIPVTFFLALGGYSFFGVLGTFLWVIIATMLIAMSLTKLTLKEDIKHGAIIGLIIGIIIGLLDPTLILLTTIGYALMGVIGAWIGHWGYQTIWAEKSTNLKTN